jgi:hypothetical protein
MSFKEQALISNVAPKVSDVVRAVTQDNKRLAAVVQTGLLQCRSRSRFN